jgi:flagellar motility protein MotE (MotC chaperone)
MSKAMKFGVAGFMLLMLVLGTVYGLAKFNVIPAQKMGERTPAVRAVLRSIGLYRPRPRVASAKLNSIPDPLAAEKQALQAQRDALKQEQADWEAQQQAKQKATEKTRATAAAVAAASDPKQLLRLASIYEQMSPDAVNKIFAKLPDAQVIELLRRMDEKQAGAILAGVTPERAARLTLALSRPPVDAATTPVRTAANLQ